VYEGALSYRPGPRAASVYGYTASLWTKSLGTGGRAREEDVASVYGHTGMV
jgi:hypothetical protein